MKYLPTSSDLPRGDARSAVERHERVAVRAKQLWRESELAKGAVLDAKKADQRAVADAIAAGKTPATTNDAERVAVERAAHLDRLRGAANLAASEARALAVAAIVADRKSLTDYFATMESSAQRDLEAAAAAWREALRKRHHAKLLGTLVAGRGLKTMGGLDVVATEVAARMMEVTTSPAVVIEAAPPR